MLGKHRVGKLLSENYPLLAILIGVVLISLPMGPYRTPDMQLEFRTVQGVLKWGYPYLDVKGSLFDLPPLGFYTAALFFLAFGSTIENGVALTALFGLGCTVMVYKLGKEAYGKSTGVFAAALFALAPWEFVLTRTFLVDTQCLFLSLVCLYFGMLAIRKDSVKLALVSGVFFAAALLTKQYAVFTMIPLLLLYVHHRPKDAKRIILQLGAFILPAVHATLLWYNIIMGKWLLYFVQHGDFGYLNLPGVVPTYTFATTFLVDYGLGVFFVAATIFSFMIGLFFRKRFSEQSFIFDLVCLTTILFIVGLDMYLGVALNLKVPYTSAFKYLYHSLPFFSLLAASLASKSVLLLKSTKTSIRLKRGTLLPVGLIGMFLLGAAIVANMIAARQLATAFYLIFRVQPGLDVGYSFYVVSPTSSNDLIAALTQFHGSMIVLSGLLWASRHFILESLKLIRSRVQAKNVLRRQGKEEFAAKA